MKIMKGYYNRGFSFRTFSNLFDLHNFVVTNDIEVVSITTDKALVNYILFYFEKL